MDKDFFVEGGISANPLHLDPVSWNGEQGFLDEQLSHFDSSFSSGISVGSDGFLLPEVMGRQGGGQFLATDDSGRMNLPPLPSFSADPGFAERAARFSYVGSRSLGSRTMKNVELGQRSLIPVMGNPKLPRACSSPSLNHGGSLPETKISTQIRRGNGVSPLSEPKSRKFPPSGLSSNDDSSVSEQMQSTETRPKNEINTKERRRGKRDDHGIGTPSFKSEDAANLKRLKPEEALEEPPKTNQKPPEPPKDYIHVRARRGQATDSHSLAERVRREKISERMKLLQDLVPGCNKVTGKALMLDEIINYVQSLQRQVEFLSMKLASVNPGMDFNTETRVHKEIHPPFHHQQFHQTAVSGSPLDSFTHIHSLPPLPSFIEDDLHSIVQMGFAQDPPPPTQ